LNIAKEPLPDLTPYGLIGFATFADFLAPPKLMQDFIRRIPQQNGKPAFVFNTYGNYNGATLRILKRLAEVRGFNVLDGFALNTPENVPPLIVGGIARIDRPKEGQLEEFNGFIARLSRIVNKLNAGQVPQPSKIKSDVMSYLIPPIPRSLGRSTMGIKSADPALCTQCGLCRDVCPYRAISMNPGPVFEQQKCFGCWSCYNHCPTKAIYTKTMRNKGHYAEPCEQLRGKLGE
jgi:ferredoxin